MEQPIEVGTEVELLADRAGVYKHATGGSLGVVKAKRDDEGFPMVYIEWDKAHWRYAGEPDCWTYEEHFQPSTKTTIFNALDNPQSFTEMVKENIERVHDPETQDDVIDEYLDRLNEVVNVLAESDGFIVIAARQEAHPNDEETTVLVPYAFGGFLNEAVMVLLEAQMVQMGAQTQIEMAQAILDRMRKRGEQE